MTKETKPTYDCLDRALDTGKQMAKLGAASAVVPGAAIGGALASPTGVGIPLGMAAGSVVVGGTAGVITGLSGGALEYASCKLDEVTKASPTKTPAVEKPPISYKPAR